MCAARLALGTLVLLASTGAGDSQQPSTPSYGLTSIVNSASGLPNDFAPNTILSIYGTNLAYNTVGVQSSNGSLPTTLGGVTVYIGSTAALLFFVSPLQINALVPYSFRSGPVPIYVEREGSAGPQVTIVLADTAPGLFQSAPGTLLATHADGSLITSAAPAARSEVIIIYAVGLGKTAPALGQSQVSAQAVSISNLAQLQVLLNGNPIDSSLLYYAGVTPKFAGLYQINVQLPSGAPPNPEVRVAIGSQISAAGLMLPTQ